MKFILYMSIVMCILQDKFDWAKYLSVVALILFILFFACGPGAIPWFLTAELFDQASRPLAVSIATLVNWASNFLAGFLFPQQQVSASKRFFIQPWNSEINGVTTQVKDARSCGLNPWSCKASTCRCNVGLRPLQRKG